VEGVSPTASFLGGFLLYIGSRLGGGCTRYSKPLLECNTCELFLHFLLLYTSDAAPVLYKTERFVVYDCSGNGLSGMGLLSILSFIFIASAFASGMTSAFLLNWYKLL